MCPANGDVLVRVNNSSMFPVVVGDSTVPSLASSRKAYMLTVLDVESSPRFYCVARKLPGGVGGFLDSRIGAPVHSAFYDALFSPQRLVSAVGPASRLSPSANAARTPQGAYRIGGQSSPARKASVSVFGSISSPGSRSSARSPASRADGALSPAARPLLASVTVPAPARVVGTGGIASQHQRRHVAPAAASTTVTADGWQYGRPAALSPPPAWRPSSSRSSNSLAASMLMPPTIPAPKKRSSLVSNILTDSEASGSDASGGPEAAFPTCRRSVRKKTLSSKAMQAAESAVDVDDVVEGVDDVDPQPSLSDDDAFSP